MSLNVVSKNAYAFRDKLRALGCRWNGTHWQAAHPKMLAAALEICDGPPPEQPWTLTVHGDAGLREGVARWAWKARHTDPPRWLDGVEQGEGLNIQEAEARALLCGVRAGLAQWAPPQEAPGLLYLRSDNLQVVTGLQKGQFKISAVEELLSIIPGNVKVDARHVPGHGKAAGTALWMNDSVDRASNLRGAVGDKRLRETRQGH